MLLSSFAISIAANIATNILLYNSKEVEGQIKEAFQAAEKDFFPNLELRKSYTAKSQLKIIEGEIANMLDNPEQKERLGRGTLKFLDYFEKHLAEKNAAYNYLKNITDEKHYREQISELSQIKENLNTIHNELESSLIRPFLKNEEFRELKFQEDFLKNDRIEEIMQLLKEGGKIIRFIALSGMGKSRIIYETFKNETLPLYYCENFDTDAALMAAHTIIGHKEKCILILDNCPSKYFQQIKNKIEMLDNKIELISIYNDPTEERIRGVSFIKIEKKELKEIVQTYLKKRLGGEENKYFHQLSIFADDIPYMAILLANALLEKGLPLGKLEDNELLNKLLGLDENNSKNKESKHILETYALFHPLGFEGEYEAQLKFVATNSHITPINIQDPEVKVARFREVFSHYHEKGLIEQLSYWVNVRPLPLAIWLTNQWFEHCSSDTLSNIIKSIENLPAPHAQDLAEAFAKRIKYMTDNPQAQCTLETLLKAGAPFHNAKVVNTILGSHLFRSFAEVNPPATVNALYDLLAWEKIEYLLNIKEEVRRNLIWTLEKLCFNRHCFKKAAKILARLAIAENESWSNNASGTFAQLFHILLPGTEADLNDRFEIIEFCYAQGEDYRHLTLTALNQAFYNNGFHRVCRAEKRGLHEMKDYVPTYEEVKDYWKKSADLLLKWTKQDYTILENACEIIENHARSLYRSGYCDLLLELIAYYAELKKYDWVKMLDILHEIEVHDSEFSSEKDSNLIKEWIRKLTRDDFYFRFSEVEKLTNRFRGTNWEKIEQEQNKLYFNLAEEYVTKEWKNKTILEQLYNHEAFFHNIFIQRICELEYESPEKINFFIENSLNILTQKKQLPANYPMFINYCSFIKQPERIQKLQPILESQKQYTLLFAITAAIDPDLIQLEYLCQLVEKGETQIENFKLYINYLKFNSLEKRIELYTRIAALGKQGNILLIPFLNLLAYHKESLKNGQLLKLIRTCVLSLPLKKTEKYDKYDLIRLAERILNIGKENEFAKQLNLKVIKELNSADSYYGLFDSLYPILIKKYGENIWNDLSTALLSEGNNCMVYYNLKNILGSRIGSGEGALFLYEEKKIWNWCKTNPQIAPIRLADMTPIYSSNKDENETTKTVTFHPIVLRLLDLYGSNEHVLDALQANMNSFSWTGSVIPLYKQKKNAFEQILYHANPKVCRWAELNIQYTDQQIEYEIKREDYDHLKYGE